MIMIFSPKGIIKHRSKISNLEREISEKEKLLGESTNQGAETWHDNAPFEAVRSELIILNNRLNMFYKEISGAEVRAYPIVLKKEVVTYGTAVSIQRDGRKFRYEIVGYGDSDIDKDRITYDSPLAKSLIGREIGDEFESKINGTLSKFEIIDVMPIKDLDLI